MTTIIRDYDTMRRADLGLMILRAVVAIIFIAHGSQKVFGMGIPALTAGFTQMQIPAASLTAPLVAYLELVGGIALLLGFATRFAAAALAVNMVGAMMFVHLKGGFFLPNGIEFVLTLCAACIAIAIAGGGFFSIDGAISLHRADAAESQAVLIEIETAEPVLR
jgi:putative oxidoreductase